MSMFSNEDDPCWDDVNFYKNQVKEFKADNEYFKRQLKELSHYLACMTEQRNKAVHCLSDIIDILRKYKEI